MTTKPRQAGFSLIEIVIVLGLVGVIAAFSVVMNFGSLSRSSVTQERDLFMTLLLRSTRSEALANKGEIAHGVHIDNARHQYVLFNGTSCTVSEAGEGGAGGEGGEGGSEGGGAGGSGTCGNTSDRVIPYTNSSVTITNTGGDTIVFDPLSGEVSTGAGTITITNGVATQKIIIRSNGQIDW